MRKVFAAAAVLSITASGAMAGGYTARVEETKPVVVKGNSSSNAGILIPVLLLVGIAVAASSN